MRHISSIILALSAISSTATKGEPLALFREILLSEPSQTIHSLCLQNPNLCRGFGYFPENSRDHVQNSIPSEFIEALKRVFLMNSSGTKILTDLDGNSDLQANFIFCSKSFLLFQIEEELSALSRERQKIFMFFALTLAQSENSLSELPDVRDRYDIQKASKNFFIVENMTYFQNANLYHSIRQNEFDPRYTEKPKLLEMLADVARRCSELSQKLRSRAYTHDIYAFEKLLTSEQDPETIRINIESLSVSAPWPLLADHVESPDALTAVLPVVSDEVIASPSFYRGFYDYVRENLNSRLNSVYKKESCEFLRKAFSFALYTRLNFDEIPEERIQRDFVSIVHSLGTTHIRDWQAYYHKNKPRDPDVEGCTAAAYAVQKLWPNLEINSDRQNFIEYSFPTKSGTKRTLIKRR